MTTALLASISAAQPVAWLQQALKPARRAAAKPVLKLAPKPAARRVRAQSQEVRELRKGDSLVLDYAGGQGVVCLEGALWITHDPVAEGAGQAAGATRMRVRALADTRLCLPSSMAI